VTRFAAAALISLAVLSGCGPAHATVAACDDAAFLAAQRARATATEVTICGTVVHVRPTRRTLSGRHRYFYVDVGNGDRIEIDANLDEMGNFPVHSGEQAVVRGEYYADPDGREGVHWTHHTDRGGHPPGFVTLNGTTYD
jgi:hypothetical protein